MRELKIGSDFEDGTYISKILVVKHLKKLKKIEFTKPVTFFVGENGTGKSTLLESIAVAYGFNAEGGSRNFNFSTYSSYSMLHNYIKLVKGIVRPKDGYFLRAESFYNVATNIEELDKIPSASPKIKESYGGKSLHEQSHGESFLSLILNRFGGDGMYILDEPEAALSPTRQMMLLSQLDNLVNKNSQFIIATHSPILLAYPNADIYQLDEEGIKLVEYKQTDTYNITKQFLDNPERMLKYLLDK